MTYTSSASKLIKNKEEFQNQLKERIDKGKALLAKEVTIITKIPEYYPGTKRLHGIETKYDETEKYNYISKYRKWNNFNMDFLNRAFNIPENEYKREYEQDLSEDFLYERYDEIQDYKKNLQLKIEELESIIDRLSIIPAYPEKKNTKLKQDKTSSSKWDILLGNQEGSESFCY